MKKTPNATGRPPKDDRQSIYSTPLYVLLISHLPESFLSPNGTLNTDKLATELDCRRATVYRWFSGDNMSNKALLALVKISNETICERKGFLTKEKLLPFVGL